MPKLTRLLPTPSMVVALVAVVVVSAGSAAAGSLITSAQIKDHTIQIKDLSNETVKKLQGRKGPRGAPGAQGKQGKQGEQGEQGEQGLAGTARGWAVVGPSGAISSSRGTFDNLLVIHPSTGVYCLSALSGTDNGLGNYDPVVATAHGQDFTKFSITINTEYGSQCNSYGLHSAYITRLDGTPTDGYFVIALM